MLNIAITAGGTSENIDGVRKMTNISTGSLGWHCLETLLDYFQANNRSDFRIYYILTETALRKELNHVQQDFVEFILVTDAESVYTTVNELTKIVSVDYFIHSMAISDFTFDYIISTNELSKEIINLPAEKIKDETAILKILENPKNKYNAGAKIPSGDNVVMAMKPTKKVIPVIKQNNHHTFLVGFKLLKDVSEKELINVANHLAEENKCDMVFANELSHIPGNSHTGVLIKSGEIIARPIGKKQIAEAIVREMTKEVAN